MFDMYVIEYASISIKENFNEKSDIFQEMREEQHSA